MKRLLVMLLALFAVGAQATVVDDYLERYFRTFTNRAPAEGLNEYDRQF